MKFPVYIPAGSQPSENEDPLLVKTNTTNKALIELNGRKIIEYVIEAVDHAEYCERIIIVGISADDIDYIPNHPIDFIPSSGSRMDTLMTMVDYLEEEYQGQLPNQILILSADIPLITGKMIDSIINDLIEEHGDNFEHIQYYYPLVPKDIVLEKYPHANKRFRKFTEGVFATGDFNILSPSVLRNTKTVETVEKILKSRKTIVRLLFKFDIFAPIKYILGRLSLRDRVLPFMKEYVDVDIALMITQYPEIVLDLDYPEDVEEMEQLVRSLKSKNVA